jgi:amino acid adenylation domain-containing protein
LQAIVADAQAEAALTTTSILSRLEPILGQTKELKALHWIIGSSDIERLAKEWLEPDVKADTLAFLQYTSGSTATPKGVMVSHGNLLHNEELIRRVFRQTEDSIIVGWLPMYHDMGLIGNVIQPLFLGARCILFTPTMFLQQPYRWLEAISRYRATTSGGPNFAYDLCVERISAEERATLDLSSWTTAFNGAEPIRAETLARFADAFGPCGFRAEAFHPCYGLAEATLLVTGKLEPALPSIGAVEAKALESNRVIQSSPDVEGARLLVGCGNVEFGQRIVVVNPESRVECMPDEVGEILVSGPSVAQGYWNQPEATEEIFHTRVANTGDDTQFLRTGDLGFIKDGELFITGRLKDLIIIRGRNHYPQDIERTVELSHIALRHGCGAAFSIEVSGEERLVVVQELKSHRASNANEAITRIRAAISDEHELAVFVVVLIKTATIPKTSSGKVRRRACREEFLRGVLSVIAEWRETVAKGGAQELAEIAMPPPRSAEEIEGWLKAQLALTTGTSADEIAVHRPIASYGLDSLAAVTLAHRIESVLGVRLPFADLLQDNSLAQFTTLLGQHVEQVAPCMRITTDTALGGSVAEVGLTHGQRSLWFLHRMSPESTAYHLVSAVNVVSDLNATALRRSFQSLVQRHPALRTTFKDSHGKPIQQVHEQMEVCFNEENAAGWSESEFDGRLLSDAHRSFDLENGPLLRVSLVQRSKQHHVLLIALHHIVADFWSLAVMIEELGALYSAHLFGCSPSLAPLTSDYTDFARSQSELLESGEGERHWSYWQKQLAAEPPPLNLPFDHVRPPVQTFRGASHCFSLSAQLTKRLKDVGRAHGATLYMTLLAVFQVLLHRYTRQTDISVGTPTAGRTRPCWAGLVGYFVNPVVMRGDLSGDPIFAALLEHTRRTALAAFEHQDYPFALLVERLQPTRDPSRSPIFQVMFVLQKAHLLDAESLGLFALGEAGARIKLGPLSLESRPLEQRVAQFDLTLALTETDGGLTASLEYNTSLFERETMERFAGHYCNLLESAAADPTLHISELNMLAEEERHHLLVELNQTEFESASVESAHALFEEQARRTPNAIAVKSGDEHITYAELNRRSNQLARHLLSLGVEPESCVALLLKRSVDLVLSAIAALKARVAYVPLDPAYPLERLRYMLRDANARVLLTHADLANTLADCDCKIVCLDDGSYLAPESEASENLNLKTCAESLAYVIYTSGSTGVPKGVAVQCNSLMNLVHWHQRTYGVLPADRATLLAGTGFDASIWELWPYLTAGASLYIPDEEVRTSPAKLVDWLTAEAITVCFLPTPLAEAVLSEDWTANSSLRLLLTGGDKLRRRLEKPFPFSFINHYGPTENTVVTTATEVGAQKTYALPPIGRPIDNTRVYLLAGGEPVPLGVTGELYIGGDSVARGYLARPDTTAERFIPDPFSSSPGTRMYRTGDLAAYLPSGEIEYRGRMDQQVKLRGYRVELGEIEAVLSGHPLVRDCAVVAMEQLSGELRLAAYLTTQSQEIPSSAELRDFLAQKLPEYMLPYAFITLDALSLTPNGKVDTTVLPAPLLDESGSNYIAPRTPTQELLTGIWAVLLGVERVGINDNFFALGGHSLLAAQLVSRVRSMFHVELSLRSVFVSPTPLLLAAEIEAASRAARGVSMPPIRRVARNGTAPLSFAQRRVWFLNQFESGSPHYNIAAAIRFNGRLDAVALERSLSELVRRHEALRTVFVIHGDEPVQQITESMETHLPMMNLERLADDERESEATRIAGLEARRLFELERGPLVRTLLLRLGENEHILLVSMHHIISDGWSTGILINELTTLYDSFSRGAASPLGELPVQYADFAYWQQHWLQREALDNTVRYWQQQLSEISPVLQLPTDYARPAVQTFQGARVLLALDQKLTESLNALSRKHDVTLFMTLLSVLQVLLMRYTGDTDISVGAPVAGRTRPETEGLIGFFVNTLVLRIDLSDDPTFTELLARTREVCLSAYEHQELPFEQLVEVVRPDRELNRSPLFQVMLVLQNSPLPEIELEDLRAEVVEVETETAKFELTITIREDAVGTLVGSIDYQTDLFSRETAERFASHYVHLLQTTAADPERHISALELLSADERLLLLLELNQPQRDYPETYVHKLFEEQVERTPDSIAVVFENHQLTYAQLNLLADRLALQLHARGIGAETLVGVMMERSVELVVALLGILKAGGAYVALDPSYPHERIAFMLDDAQVCLLLTQRDLQGVLTDLRSEVLYVDEMISAELQSDNSVADPARYGTPDNLAYLIYTSGSTGRPKGVMITHRAICNHLQWRQRAYPLTSTDRFLHKASISFDISIWEIFAPLIAGAQLVLAKPHGQQDSRYLVQLMAQKGITVAHFGPSMLESILDEPEINGCGSLHDVFCGGESLTQILRRRFFDTMPAGIRLHHQYGPTETTIDVMVWDCEIDEVDSPRPVSIGRGIDNVRLYVLDARMQPVPWRVVGELYVGGVPLARGYLNRPNLTAEKFLPDAFSDEPGARIYRTGDLVRHLADGKIEYVGRMDQQVKLRGFRIELGEIETALRTYKGMRDCVVVVRDQGEDKRLVAYVVAEDDQLLVSDVIRGYLKKRLPEFMLPQAYITISSLPLTSNGKIDRNALPAPEQLRPQLQKPFAAPRNEIERLIAGAWTEILELDRVGVDDNFFDLGGHSLMATRVHTRLRRMFNQDIPLRMLFEKPTVAELAAAIDRIGHNGNQKNGPPVTRVPRDGDLPLSFAQQRLWFLDRLEAGRTAYNIPTAVHLTGTLDIEALQRGLNEMVRRHESLRTAFVTTDGQPRQMISDAIPLALAIDDLTRLAEPERSATAKLLMAQESAQPFDLSVAPLLRARLLLLAAEEQLLVVVFHHIVSDGWSLGVFVRELCTLYEAYTRGEESPLPELPLQYADFAQWQRERLSGEQLRADLEYWGERLGGGPEPLALATDRVRPSVAGFAGSTQSFVLRPALTARLKELSREQEATLFMTLLAGFQLLLWRYTGQEDISVGTPVAGRTRRETEGLLGFFVNTLVLRTDLSGGPTFAELLGRVKEVCLGGYQHQELPFEQLVEALQPEREVSRTPLFQVMLVLQNMPLLPVQMSGLKAKTVEVESGTAKFELSLYLREIAEGLSGIIEYKTELFDPDTIKRFSDHFIRLLENVVADPHQQISQLQMLSEEERHQSVTDWNDTRCDYVQKGECLHELFEEQARQTPDAIAVMYADDHVTYAELNERANQLARLLRRKGVGCESRVGLLLERSIELVIGALAVLKAGAAYVPLDPAYPFERLSYIVRDAGASVLLVHSNLSEVTNKHSANAIREWGVCEVISTDATGWTEAAVESNTNLHTQTFADNLAYVIYTSGSTGTPKGVLGLHRGAVNRFRWMWETYPFQAGDVCCQKTSMSFVDFAWELFGPLIKGVRTVIIPDAIVSDPRRFIEALAAANVTRLVLVPSLLDAMLEAGDDLGTRLPKLKLWVVSGEALPSRLPQRFQQEVPNSTLLNLYGSSEVSADVTCCEVNTQPSLIANSIGRPIANTQVHLLDAHLQLVPRIAWGELHVGGANLARGYSGRPDLTAEKFIPNPFSGEPGARMYRTGDRARHLPDGQIEFRGRVDQQVNLRGFRIEPGEVEAVLVGHPNVHNALVMIREEKASEQQLVAYLVAREPESPPTVDQLRSHLRMSLPEYMIPSEFLLLDAFPLTSSGKVDRQAIHAHKGTRIRNESVYVAPQTEVERTIVSVLQEILRIDRIGINDNFFELGGHSLLLVKLQSRLQIAFKRNISLVELFEYPTAGSLTRYFSDSKNERFSVREVQNRIDKQAEVLSRRRQSIQERKQVG